MNDILTNDEIEKLIAAARKARKNAYAPYSGFSVGAAVLGKNRKIYTGCNVENVSYGLTNCAERIAVFKAVSEGIKDFIAVAIYANTEDYCTPCGACRQVIAEFGKDILVIQANKDGKHIMNTIDELLPGAFSANIL